VSGQPQALASLPSVKQSPRYTLYRKKGHIRSECSSEEKHTYTYWEPNPGLPVRSQHFIKYSVPAHLQTLYTIMCKEGNYEFILERMQGNFVRGFRTAMKTAQSGKLAGAKREACRVDVEECNVLHCTALFNGCSRTSSLTDNQVATTC
jgi:hypothetical protein